MLMLKRILISIKIVKLFIKIFVKKHEKNSNNWMWKNFFKHLEAIKILEKKKKLNLVAVCDKI